MARVPRRLPGAAEGLPAPQQHLLASVDGTLDEEELAFVVGMSPEQVAEALARLEERGVVTFAPAESAAGAAAPPPERSVTADGISLGADERMAIDKLLELVSSADYYRMLGLPREATTAQIKSAYYKVGPRYHPDRYFGKNLGPYKQKIETIFSRLTKAHDTLRHDQRRESYDDSLPPLRPGDRIPHVAPDEPAAPRPPADRRSHPGLGSVSSQGARPSSPGPIPSSPLPRSSMPGPPSSPVPRSSDPGPAPSRPSFPSSPRFPPTVRKRELSPEELKAQRELVARKLRAAANPPVDPLKQPAPATPPRTSQRARDSLPPNDGVGKSAAEAMRDRYDQAVDVVRQRRLQRYLETGRVAMLAGDFRAAAAAFEQALRLSPDDPAIRDKAAEAARLVKAR